MDASASKLSKLRELSRSQIGEEVNPIEGAFVSDYYSSDNNSPSNSTIEEFTKAEIENRSIDEVETTNTETINVSEKAKGIEAEPISSNENSDTRGISEGNTEEISSEPTETVVAEKEDKNEESNLLLSEDIFSKINVSDENKNTFGLAALARNKAMIIFGCSITFSIIANVAVFIARKNDPEILIKNMITAPLCAVIILAFFIKFVVENKKAKRIYNDEFEKLKIANLGFQTHRRDPKAKKNPVDLSYFGVLDKDLFDIKYNPNIIEAKPDGICFGSIPSDNSFVTNSLQSMSYSKKFYVNYNEISIDKGKKIYGLVKVAIREKTPVNCTIVTKGFADADKRYATSDKLIQTGDNAFDGRFDLYAENSDFVDMFFNEVFAEEINKFYDSMKIKEFSIHFEKNYMSIAVPNLTYKYEDNFFNKYNDKSIEEHILDANNDLIAIYMFFDYIYSSGMYSN